VKTTAAVLVETGKPLELMDLTIPPLKPGQVLVELAYSGVCHTQLLEARGRRGHDAFLPHCLGHEGSGVVLDVSPGVSKVKPGDRVVLSWIQGSGMNIPGSVYDSAAGKVNAGAITTFMTHAVISENRLTVIGDKLSMRDAAMLGCAAPTGLGAVLNTGQFTAGQSAVIFGAGGVGLCAIAGAAIAGGYPVIAVDPVAAKRHAAREVGATHDIDPMTCDVLQAISAIVPGGVDLAIEATGRPEVMAQALACVRPRGGAAVIIGNAHHGQQVTIDPKHFNLGKQLRGTWGGDSQPDRDLPRFARFIEKGSLKLAPMLTEGYTLESINQALDDLEQGRAVRPIITLAGEVRAGG